MEDEPIGASGTMKKFVLYTRDDRSDMIVAAIESRGLHPVLIQKSAGTDYPSQHIYRSERISYLTTVAAALRAGNIVAVLGTAGYDKSAVLDSEVGRLAAEAGIAFSGQGLATTELAMDKGRTRSRFLDMGISTPRGTVVTNEDELTAFRAKLRGPVIVKPLQGISGRGQFTLLPGQLTPIVETPHVAEEFVFGLEVSLDVFSHERGHLVMPPLVKGHTSLEVGHAREKLRYASWNMDQRDELRALAVEVSRAVGSSGWINIDLIVDQGGRVVVLEVNARYSGTTRLSWLSTGINPYEIALGSALGDSIRSGELPVTRLAFEFPIRSSTPQPLPGGLSIHYSSFSPKFIGTVTGILPTDPGRRNALRRTVRQLGAAEFLAEYEESLRSS